MARIPSVTRESVPEDQRAIFDEFVQQRGGNVPTGGPFSVILHVPEIASREEELRGYLRNGSSLPQRIQELAMITTARELDCVFIWNAHAAAGRREGLRDDIVDNLREKRELTNLADDEAIVLNYAREFFRTNRVSQATFDAALAQFGVRGLTELTNLLGCYAILAFNMNTFGVEVPAEHTEPVLPV